jgi:hypothetical protein
VLEELLKLLEELGGKGGELTLLKLLEELLSLEELELEEL